MAQDVIQLYLSLKLSSPTLSLSAFCKAISEAAWRNSMQQVGFWLLSLSHDTSTLAVLGSAHQSTWACDAVLAARF